MAELLGIITSIKKFMSNSNEKIYFPLNGEKKEALSLEKDRIFLIFKEKLDGHVIMLQC